MKKKTNDNVGRLPEGEAKNTASPGSRKKSFDPWQDMVKFQQELTSMRSVEEDQDMRLLRLEFFVKKFQKNLTADETNKVELNRTTKYYLTQLTKLDGEAKRLKAMSEKKLQMLDDLRRDAEQYVNAVKIESKRHLTVMMSLNNELVKNLEKLKKVSSEEFEELEAMLRPSSRWTIFSKSKRSLTPSLERPDSELTNESLSSLGRPKTQGQERSKVDFLERPKTIGLERNLSHPEAEVEAEGQGEGEGEGEGENEGEGEVQGGQTREGEKQETTSELTKKESVVLKPASETTTET